MDDVATAKELTRASRCKLALQYEKDRRRSQIYYRRQRGRTEEVQLPSLDDIEALDEEQVIQMAAKQLATKRRRKESYLRNKARQTQRQPRTETARERDRLRQDQLRTQQTMKLARQHEKTRLFNLNYRREKQGLRPVDIDDELEKLEDLSAETLQEIADKQAHVLEKRKARYKASLQTQDHHQ